MIKRLLGLNQLSLKDYEIMAKIDEAWRKNIGEIDFIDEDGSKVRILLPRNIHDDFLETS